MTFNPQLRRNKRGTKAAEKFTPNVPERGIGVEYTTGKRWIIYLDRKKIGHIFEIENIGGSTFQYMPMGARSGGETFATFAECRRSLDDDE